MSRAGLNLLPRPARSALNQEVRQGSCEWLCHSWDAGSESRLVARSKKERHPHGCLSFLEQHFCYAKVVACGRVIEREWGNPSKVPPSHSPFLAVGGSADNKTCGQSQKETPSVRMVFLFGMPRAGWNSLPRPARSASNRSVGDGVPDVPSARQRRAFLRRGGRLCPPRCCLTSRSASCRPSPPGRPDPSRPEWWARCPPAVRGAAPYRRRTG